MPYETMHHSQQHHHPTSTANGMFDTLSLQLRDAETRRSEIERAHQVSYNTTTFFAIFYFKTKPSPLEPSSRDITVFFFNSFFNCI